MAYSCGTAEDFHLIPIYKQIVVDVEYKKKGQLKLALIILKMVDSKPLYRSTHYIPALQAPIVVSGGTEEHYLLSFLFLDAFYF